ncbi:unnamed protein product [Cylindrotheca closterium]|uniref:Disease resistance R13L4/SHOC-2-like LRR domain-containing protein n=1 Tax=Cylindrotheca closterium TaxID=2856 RepID=A0AAD2JMQ6_9STRA|nr:unnamed protein product [Cylindrotheca closterium]
MVHKSRSSRLSSGHHSPRKSVLSSSRNSIIPHLKEIGEDPENSKSATLPTVDVSERSDTAERSRTRSTTRRSSSRSHRSRRSINKVEENEEDLLSESIIVDPSESSTIEASERSERSTRDGFQYPSELYRSPNKRHSKRRTSQASTRTLSKSPSRSKGSSSSRASLSSSKSPRRASSFSKSPKSTSNRRSHRASSSSMPASINIDIDKDNGRDHDTFTSNKNNDGSNTHCSTREVMALQHELSVVATKVSSSSPPKKYKIAELNNSVPTPHTTKRSSSSSSSRIMIKEEAIDEAEDESVEEHKKQKRRAGSVFGYKCCCAVVALLALLIGGSVLGVIFISDKNKNTTETSKNQGIEQLLSTEPSFHPTTAKPTASPTNCPTVLFPSAPEPKQCKAIARNQTVPNQDEMDTKELEIFFDVTLDDNDDEADMEALLPQLMAQIQSRLLPSFAGCPDQSQERIRRLRLTQEDPCGSMNPYVIMNAIAKGDYKAELSCQDSVVQQQQQQQGEEDNCNFVAVNLKVFLYGQAKMLDLIGSFSSNVGNNGPLVDRLGLHNSPFKIIKLVGMQTLDITESPSAPPSSIPSLSPSDTPSSHPSTSTPSLSPSRSPTSNPTVEASKTPTFAPSTTPTLTPTKGPTPGPSKALTLSPTTKALTTNTPTTAPSKTPTIRPTLVASISPTELSSSPSLSPTTAAPTTRAGLLAVIVPSTGTPCEITAFDWLSNVDTWTPAVGTAPKDLDSIWTERYSLAVFYCVINGPVWERQDNWLSSVSVCSWGGVTCNGMNRVISLVRTRIQVRDAPGRFRVGGFLPTDLGALSELANLSLQNNALTGTLPTELANLGQLTNLDFDSNKIAGMVPSQLGTNLQQLKRLYLKNNKLTGAVPTEIGSLTLLTELRLNFNQFRSTIPTEFGKLSLLKQFTIGINNWSGSLPSEMSSISLTWFGCRSTPLTGCIPMQASTMSTGDTRFTGFC